MMMMMCTEIIHKPYFFNAAKIQYKSKQAKETANSFFEVLSPACFRNIQMWGMPIKAIQASVLWGQGTAGHTFRKAASCLFRIPWVNVSKNERIACIPDYFLYFCHPI
jgi:hypothetical protein